MGKAKKRKQLKTKFGQSAFAILADIQERQRLIIK